MNRHRTHQNLQRWAALSQNVAGGRPGSRKQEQLGVRRNALVRWQQAGPALGRALEQRARGGQRGNGHRLLSRAKQGNAGRCAGKQQQQGIAAGIGWAGGWAGEVLEGRSDQITQ